MEFVIFYLVAIVILIVSIIRDRSKTLLALKKTIKGIQKLMPQMTFILLLIGISLTIISPEMISASIGKSSGIMGLILSILAGAISFLPSFIAFPLGATLLEQGAGLPQVAGFVSSLMGIGIITLSMEKKFFGIHFAIYRNLGSLIMTIIFVTAIWMFTGVRL